MYVKTLNGLSLDGAWKIQLMLYACWILGFGAAWLIAGDTLPLYPSLLSAIMLASGITLIVYVMVRKKENFQLIPKISMSVETFLLAFSMSLALVVVKDALGYILPLPSWPELAFTSIHTGSALAIILSVVLSAFVKELLFRGIIMEALLRRYSGGVALLQSSILFMLAHPDPAQMPGALLLGLLSGFFYLRLRDLCACFLVHLVHNCSTAMIILGGGSLQFVVSDPYTYIALVSGCAMALAAGYFVLRNITAAAYLKRPVLFAK